MNYWGKSQKIKSACHTLFYYILKAWYLPGKWVMNYWLTQIKEIIKPGKQLVFFVTNRCNLKCKHCFYPANTKPKELTLEEIKDFSDKKQFTQVILTGGEPFLRSDIIDVAKIFINKGCRINIDTNGSYPERVEMFVKEMPNAVFQISIDGNEELHDRIRKNGSYRKAMETLNVLRENKIRTIVSTSINKLNYKNIPKVCGTTHLYNFTRSAELHTFNVPKELLSGFDSNITLDLQEMKEAFGRIKWDRSLFGMVNKMVMARAIKDLKKRKPTPCSAGKTEMVLYPDGKIGICEMLKPGVKKPKNCGCIHDCRIMSRIKRPLKF